MDDNDPKAKTSPYSLGEDLSRRSIAELGEIVRRLADEQARVEAEIAAKSADRAAAEQLFKS
ncbi:MAG: DUF1192 family protein [Pseudomonadota bacterium]